MSIGAIKNITSVCGVPNGFSGIGAHIRANAQGNPGFSSLVRESDTLSSGQNDAHIGWMFLVASIDAVIPTMGSKKLVRSLIRDVSRNIAVSKTNTPSDSTQLWLDILNRLAVIGLARNWVDSKFLSKSLVGTMSRQELQDFETFLRQS